MSDNLDQGDGAGGKHGSARSLAEQALAAQARGDDDEADRLFAEANRADPAAVDALLSESVVTREPVRPAGNDDEIAAMSRTLEDDDAPSRSGISGRGSGADNEGT